MRVAGRHGLAAIFIFGLALVAWMQFAREPALESKIAALQPGRSTNPASTQLQSASTDNVSRSDVVTHAGGRLRGRVVDAATNEPVTEFRIEFFGPYVRSPTPGARDFRSADGRFDWQNLMPERWSLVVNAVGYQRFELSGVVIRDGETAPDLIVPLRKGVTLTGRVYDELTGAGIASAQVSIRDAQLREFEGNWRRRQSTFTNRSGSFSLDGVPPGRITLSVASGEHATRQLTITVEPGIAALQISLSAGSMIAGRLTAADGVTAIEGEVGLFEVERGFGSSSKWPNGQFEYTNLEPGSYQLRGSSPAGYAQLDLTIGANDRKEDIVLRITRGAVIRGTITGLSAQDLATAGIVTSTEGGVFAADEASVDSRGGYIASGLRPGRVRIAAIVGARRQMARIIEVPAEAQLTVDFHFARGSRLSGRVLRNGEPLPNVSVHPELIGEQELFVLDSRSAADGAYVLDHLPHGEYRLIIAGYKSPAVRIAGDTVFDVDLPALAQFAGRVIDESSGVPIVGASVDLLPDSGMKVLQRRHATDHFGGFAFAGLQPGDYLLTIYKPQYAMHRERISLGSGGGDRVIRLLPDRGVQIRARSARTGQSLRFVHAQELSAGLQTASFRLALDEDGIAFLPHGLIGSTLAFRAEGFAALEVRAWNGGELDLRMEPREQN